MSPRAWRLLFGVTVLFVVGVVLLAGVAVLAMPVMVSISMHWTDAFLFVLVIVLVLFPVLVGVQRWRRSPTRSDLSRPAPPFSATHAGWSALFVAGIVVMGIASKWAPAQPEFMNGGGSCEISLCGMLTDPPRWRHAWWLWLVGLAMSLPASAFIGRGLRLPRWRVLVLGGLLGVVLLPFYLLGVLLIAFLVSLVSSMHGAATTGALLVLFPAVAVVGSWIRERTSVGD